MQRTKIGIWGQFGDGGMIADGQAVRTTIITSELQERYGSNNVRIVNTNNWKNHPLKFFISSLKLIAQCDTVLIAPADNGFKVFVPIIALINSIFRRKIVYIVIGGFLPKLLAARPIYIKFIRKFHRLFVQTNNLKQDLEKLGINNISILSNLKRLDPVSKDDIKLNEEPRVKLCVFSRVTKAKGIEDAIAAVNIVNNKLNGKFVTLDIYGLLPKHYESSLKQLLDDNKDVVEYKGLVLYYDTVRVLQKYFALLFPTYYHGEGFPGNVIDAYNSGLPIIATNWLYNSEVIREHYNGLLVPIKDPQALAEAILELYTDRNLHYQIAMNNIREAERYTPEIVLKELFELLELDEDSKI